jgi:hypothetical protein
MLDFVSKIDKLSGQSSPKGISVKELAVQIEGNEASIRTWIYRVGEKIAGLQKVAPGTFAYTSNP